MGTNTAADDDTEMRAELAARRMGRVVVHVLVEDLIKASPATIACSHWLLERVRPPDFMATEKATR